MIGFWRKRPTLDEVRAVAEVRRETLKDQRTKTDDMEKAVSGLLDELLLRGLHDGR